jgi:predicted kinase
MNQQLTVIRGAPGSGKSTLAARLCADTTPATLPASGHGTIILELDSYRMIDGVYVYDEHANMRIAEQMYTDTITALVDGHSVIVANTFIRTRTVVPYRMLAKRRKIAYQELICLGEFGSVHGVSHEQAAAMRRQLEL